MKPLYGHVSEASAFLVRDYPYGNKRCRIRFWIEQHATRGFRLVTQTEHPRLLKWNKPHPATYVRLAACLYLDEKEHVQCATLHEYSTAQEVLKFLKDFPEAPVTMDLKLFILGKIKLAEKKSKGEPFMTMNGQPVAVTETDREAGIKELPIWQECRTTHTQRLETQ